MYDGETIEQAIARVTRATFLADCSNKHPLSFPDDDDFGLVTHAAAAPF
jgi:hypothetical protein